MIYIYTCQSNTTVKIMKVSITSKSFFILFCNAPIYPSLTPCLCHLTSFPGNHWYFVSKNNFPFPIILCEWNSTVCIPFCQSSLVQPIYFSIYAFVACVTISFFFNLWLISLYVDTPRFGLYVQQVVGIWIVSNLGLL